MPQITKYSEQIHIATEGGGSIWHLSKDGKLIFDKKLSRKLDKHSKANIVTQIKSLARDSGLVIDGVKLEVIDDRLSEVALLFRDKELVWRLPGFAQKLAERLSGFIVVYSSVAVDIVSVKKEDAVKELAERINVDLKDIVVCGDGPNDFGMLALNGIMLKEYGKSLTKN